MGKRDTTMDGVLMLAVLVGQCDGEAFVSDAAMRAVDASILSVSYDLRRHGYVLRLRPDESDQFDGKGGEDA